MDAIFERLPVEVMWTLGGIFALLVASTVIVWAMRRAMPQRNLGELSQRVRTWWLMAGIFTIAMLLSRNVSIVFFALVSFLALKEYFSLIPTRRADRRIMFWAYLTVPVQYALVATEWYGFFIVFIPVYVFLLLPVRMILVGETRDFLRAAGTIHWGIMATVFSLSHAAFLLILRLKDDPTRAVGPGLVLFLVLATQMNDVLQFIWGKAIGGPKIVPKVSPGKTWAGFLGGVGTTAALAALLGPLLTPMSAALSAGAGLIIAASGFAGDVTISAIKRDLQVKDSGTMLPGHGGILDRIDSLTYSAPLFFHYVYFLFLWNTHGAAGHGWFG